MTHSDISRIVDKLDLYRTDVHKTYVPQSRDDWKEIIEIANELLKAAGAK